MAAKLRIYNTLSREVEDFVPLVPGQVGFYSCGPTVYAYQHIGNMRSYIFADTLKKTLEHFGFQVNHVMNITDVGHLTDDADSGDDKLEVGARREGLTAWDVAKKFTDIFFDHATMLNIRRPSIVCKATDYIKEQLEMVVALEKKGFTYRTTDGVYFDTAKFADYPKLGHLDVKGLRGGERVDLGEKRQKTDFALWKFSQPADHRSMEWDSPWGRGFPGWHIECSAMSVKFLGEQFDLHTGGVDHIPIHHTNELAQTECATGKHPFVKYWMHGEFLVIDDDVKMSKSLGHVLTVQTLVDKGFNPLAYRLLVLQGHYRKQLKFNFDNLTGAQRGYDRLLQLIQKIKAEAANKPAATLSPAAQKYADGFDNALANDLNMPQAIGAMYTLLEDAEVTASEKLSLLSNMDTVFSLDLLSEPVSKQETITDELQDLLKKRNAARASKDWAEADKMRQAIAAKGYEILDSPAGSSLKKRL